MQTPKEKQELVIKLRLDGATIYVNYKRREVVSTDIKYLGLLEE